jgi:hypothetical protein
VSRQLPQQLSGVVEWNLGGEKGWRGGAGRYDFYILSLSIFVYVYIYIYIYIYIISMYVGHSLKRKDDGQPVGATWSCL